MHNQRHLRFALLLFMLFFLSGCTSIKTTKENMPMPAHHTETGFKNLYIDDVKKSFFAVLKMRFFDKPWSNHEAFSDQIPWQPLNLEAVHNPPDQPQISWLGHSTFLIQYRGVNLLTDPVFSERTSPFGFIGPKRYTKHAVDYSELPQIDYVVISHNHYDHLDTDAIELLNGQAQAPKYYVPLGIKAWLLQENRQIQAQDVIEMDWHQTHQQDQIKMAAYPSQHWSARSLFDRFETLWASWRIQLGDFSVWFAGDTGYNERLFMELGELIPAVDLSLIPIGAYEPRGFMKPYHTNPEEAVLIHQHIETRYSIGTHWGAYPLTAEDPIDPPKRLKLAVEQAGLKPNEFTVMEIGESRVLD